MQRAAAERREAGAEDRPGIDQIGVGDDALGQCAPSPRTRSGRIKPIRRARRHRRPARSSPPCRPTSRRIRAWSCARDGRPRSIRSVFFGRRGVPPQHLADRQADVESDGVGQARSGPTGMPNASAASSTVSGAMPSSTQRIASMRYGARMRLTRKPGALLTGSGSLSICRANARRASERDRRACSRRRRSRPASFSATGLKKCSPIRRAGSRSGARDLLQRNARGIGREQRRGLGLRLERRRTAAASLRGSRRSLR